MDSSRVLHKNAGNFPTFCRQKENALPADPAARFLAKGVLERREVEKRIYGGERQRLTACHDLSVIKIIPAFEHPITELKTIFDEFVNELQSS
jgi:hypothetical protein